MAGFTVDEMGNCWDEDAPDSKIPVMGHPELEGRKAKCPKCGTFIWRQKLNERTFTWKCGKCGWEDADWHH